MKYGVEISLRFNAEHLRVNCSYFYCVCTIKAKIQKNFPEFAKILSGIVFLLSFYVAIQSSLNRSQSEMNAMNGVPTGS